MGKVWFRVRQDGFRLTPVGRTRSENLNESEEHAIIYDKLHLQMAGWGAHPEIWIQKILAFIGNLYPRSDTCP